MTAINMRFGETVVPAELNDSETAKDGGIRATVDALKRGAKYVIKLDELFELGVSLV